MNKYHDTIRVIPSPSSRRAGIEMMRSTWATRLTKVALLAEGGDRNGLVALPSTSCSSSPSSRRAGIEIADRRSLLLYHKVALLAEGGDRNKAHALQHRLPRWSPSSRRAGIEIASANWR